jgi:ligand-binding sensor domain-containing protein/signal transduction histidine kinase/ActR/RegA family two-component response regulator
MSARPITTFLCALAVVVGLAPVSPAADQSLERRLPTEASLPPDKPLVQFHHDVWQTREGLPQNSVETIAQTRDGFLWLGTRQGLSRFDGHQFVTYDKVTTPALGHIQISRLLATRDGSLWIGTHGGGLSRMRDRRIQTYTTRDGLPGNSIISLFEDSHERIWIATDGGLVRFANERFEPPTDVGPLTGVIVSCVLQDYDGSFWFGTLRHGLLRSVGGQLTAYGVSSGLPDAHVTSLVEDRRGTVWAGTPRGLASLRAERVTVKLPAQSIGALHVDRRGTVWVGTIGEGLVRIVDGEINGALTSADLSDDVVLTLFEDIEGSLWLGTGAGGLNRLHNRPLVLYGQREGLSRFATSTIYQDHQHRMWVGTAGGGLFQYVNGRFARYTAERDRLGSDVITSLVSGGDTLWIGTDGGGVSRLRHGEFATVIPASALPSPTVRVVEIGRENTLWIGTDGGVVRYREGEPLQVIRTAEGLSNNSVQILHVDDKDALWVGTNGGGITIIDGASMRHITTAQGLASNFVTAFHQEADGAIWVGTYGGGLTRVKDQKLCHVNSRRGLFDDVIFDLIEDDRPAPNLWMNSARGIFAIPVASLRAACEGRIQQVNGRLYNATESGQFVEGSSGQQPLSWRADDGRLWFATQRGALIIDPNEVVPLPPAPPVIVERITVDGADRAAHVPYRARWNGGAVRFRWTAPTFRVTPIRFRYRLEGFDAEWVDAGVNREAAYTNLPPGPYRFHVKSDNGAGDWSAEETVVALTMLPRFYQTSWFYVALAVGGLGLAFLAYRARVRQLRERERRLTVVVDERTRALQREMTERVRAEEERRALDRRMQDAQRLESLGLLAGGIAHDFNNLLVGILGQAGLAQMDLPPESPVREQVQQIERAATRAAELTSQLLAYSGRGRFVLERVDVSALVIEMAKLLETVIARNVEIEFRFAPGLPAIEADPAQVRQVVMNLLTNASDALAGRPGRITVTTDVTRVAGGTEAGLAEGSFVRLVVQDTGCGMDGETVARIFDPFFTTKFTGRGLGLAAVQGIVRGHHGAIHVQSTPQVGTIFEVLFPALDQPAPVVTLAPLPSRPGHARGTVLLVDDEASVRSVGRVALERSGFEVMLASDGREAVQVYRQKADAVDCVLLDLTMPKLSGVDTLRELRGIREDVCVVLSSGFTEQDAVARVSGAPAHGFIQKPWKPDALVQAIERALALSVRARVPG